MTTLEEFRNIWDGNEPGWKLVRYSSPVYLVEFIFDEPGPTPQERAAAMEFYRPLRENPVRLDDCLGFAIPDPITQHNLIRLKTLEFTCSLKLNVVEIAPGDLLLIRPDGHHFNWLISPGIEFRIPLTQKMLETGAQIQDLHEPN